MVFFTAIRKSDHYRREHEAGFPWHEAIQIILTTKNPRKKGDRIEIERERAYILCELRGRTLFVINAKRR